MIMRLLFQTVVVFLFVPYVFTASIDHDLFEKEAHLHEIGIQMQYMQDKLYANCPNVFQTPNSGSLAIIGRRRSIDSSLDQEIELAEKTLEDLISEFVNCTSSTPIMTLRTLTETRTPMTSTETTSHPTLTETTSHPTSTETSSHPTSTETTIHPTLTETTSHPTSTETTSHPTSTETTSHPTSTETTSHPTSVQSTSTNLLHTAIHRSVATKPAPQSVDLLNCNFERNTCYYSSSQGDDFDWTRIAGSTVSAGTGPVTDHTLGNRAGHYMYMEASSPSKQGQRARLVSGTITQTGSACASFYYHMYGINIGSLNVYVKKQTSSGSSHLGPPVWGRQGNQGNRWIMGQVALTQSQSFQLIFEGIVGNGYQGDIAIDDITVKSGSCAEKGACSFDNGNLCTWTNQRSEDEFDWTFGRTGTPTRGTGPSADHTTGNGNGHYIYIETSSPRQSGQKALLHSALFSPTGSTTKCLRFWYHMYGSHMGSLNIYLPQNGASPGTKVWSLSGNQGNQWHFGNVAVKSNTQYSIIFEGIVGNGMTGDIALDDLSIASGQCALSPSKAFPSRSTTPTPN